MMETMADLVKQYNALKPKKRVTRFSNKAAGVNAIAQLKQQIATEIFPTKPRDRSAATKATWNNKVVAQARAVRTKVIVQGHGEFASAAKAFAALNLPRAGMIRFRMALKQTGARTFLHEGITYQFFVVKETPNGQVA